jgi:hypothetical protein
LKSGIWNLEFEIKKMNYYYLISGLPDIRLDEQKNVPSMAELRAELEAKLSEQDVKLLYLIYAKYDNRNLILYLENKEAELNPLGSYTADDLKDLTEHELMKADCSWNYLVEFCKQHKDENFSFDGISAEDYLSGMFYEYAVKESNEFLHDWFEFNLNINNLQTAIACRKHGFDLQRFVLGDSEVARTLRKSNARDFGLKSIFAESEEIIRIAEETNLLVREKQIDELKWKWLEQHTFFSYFSVERVLAFVLKCELINRWKPLAQEKGTQIFRELLDELKAEVNFEE